MDPRVSIALVLGTGLLWAVFTVLMLARLNRQVRRVKRQQRKAARMKNRPDGHTDGQDEPGRTRRHRLKGWRHHTPPAPGGASPG